MRNLLILCFFMPLIAWGQSSLLRCPETGVKHNCFGSISLPSGARYVGEWWSGKRNGRGTVTQSNGAKYEGEFLDDKYNGKGTYTFANGAKFAGEFRDNRPHGQLIEYDSNGSVLRSGIWENGVLVIPKPLDTNLFPFDPTLPISVAETPRPAMDSSNAERDRLAAELDAERKRRQALEDRLASEARERERIAAIRVAQQQTGDGSPDDQTCRQYGFVVATTPYAN